MYFSGPLDARKVVEKTKKKFLWIIPYNGTKDYWLTLSSFIYSDGVFKIKVPSGFKTDLASVPRFARSLFSTDGPWTQAAVLHDYLYNQRGKSLGPNGRDLDRSECDIIFLTAMRDLGVSIIERRPIYRAVRIGGWVPWGKQGDDDDYQNAIEHEIFENNPLSKI